ncbi:alpha/beta hydrolase [cf. Phormidesmis sp. LEGE 11477]|uniref:alpha/beta hydrolase n=1 Tax=cf. Phormidesmis sp. LEGE 11477 TaxID=1828680 RepID=UPI001880D0A1|nr:alpha/beta hydrolase [cf. Phormidesmis sp. LEGE 11477]MBE9059661.1 alpha/beta hydrolase [cf. Phormidesmis sp. LEGE 11477]
MQILFKVVGLIASGASWLAIGTLLFLSLWIVLPAPNFFLLPLAVGAPAVSPLLGGLGAIALLLTLGLIESPPRPVIAILLIVIALNSLPLLQQPRAVATAERSMAQAFSHSSKDNLAKDDLAKDDLARHQLAPVPAFSLSNFFRGIPQANVRHQAKIPFASPAGEDLFLDMYQPRSPGRYPAVMMIYGGGWRTGSSGANEALGRFLASRGYVVVAADYRHSPQYQFPAQLEDISAALAFIRDHADEYEIMPDRIALLGWSAGAQLAMLTGFQAPQTLLSQALLSEAPLSEIRLSETRLSKTPLNLPSTANQLSVRAIVSYYGPVDLANGYRNPPRPDPLDVRQVLEDYLGGSPDERPAAYTEASPITYVKAATPDSLPPVLLIHGGRDHIVEAKYGSYLYEQILRSRNTAVWVKIPWAEHAFDKIFNGVGNQMALHFLERFLAETIL